jgi:hypothetical protein
MRKVLIQLESILKFNCFLSMVYTKRSSQSYGGRKCGHRKNICENHCCSRNWSSWPPLLYGKCPFIYLERKLAIGGGSSLVHLLPEAQVHGIKVTTLNTVSTVVTNTADWICTKIHTFTFSNQYCGFKVQLLKAVLSLMTTDTSPVTIASNAMHFIEVTFA